MLGRFQSSQIRIEIAASEVMLLDSLTRPALLQQWLQPLHLSSGLPERLYTGLVFTSQLGSIRIEHRVEQVETHYLRLILSQGIDGFHEWYWGEGWVQSRLEGVSLLPLHLGQTLGLFRLRQFLLNHPRSGIA
jgi:hypothetical protein